MGGGGSGKSIFAGRKILERISTEENHRILVCRKIAKTLKESSFSQLLSQINDHYIKNDFKINITDLKITNIKTNSEIIFSGLDDSEKLKSIFNISGIWIEEASELSESDFNQIDIRLRGQTKQYKQIILSFNPISVNHWLKKRFFDVKKSNIKLVHSTYHDNKFLDKAQINVLENFKETDEYYYSVYCLGQWGSYQKSVFNNKNITNRIKNLTIIPTIKKLYYELFNNKIIDNTINFYEDEYGEIKIYKPPDNNITYCIGCDTASDNGFDNFVAQVINHNTGEQVAVLSGKFDEDIFSQHLYCLGKYYNNALIGIEVNFSTYPAKELFRLGYENQYVRENLDSINEKTTDKIGFITNRITRPIILGSLIQMMRENIDLINDSATLYEMLSFIRDKNGKMCAEYSYHDDLVMALAISYHIRTQQVTNDIYLNNLVDTTSWTSDMIEDYSNTDEMGKIYLARKFNT